MIVKMLISFSLLATFSPAFCGQEPLGLCEKEGQNFGNGQGRDLISFGCVELFKKSANVEAIKISANGKVSAFGHRNMIFIKQNEKMRVISGNYTELEDVTAIAIDEANQELAVLTKKGDVLFFSSKITGNVAPLRVIKNKDLHGASDLVINSKKNELIVLNKTSRSLLFFPRLADVNGRKQFKKLGVQRAVRNFVGQESLSIDEEHQELFSLNVAQNTVHVFDLNNLSQSLVPLRTIPLSVEMNDPSKLEYSQVNDQIVVTNREGKLANLARTTAAK